MNTDYISVHLSYLIYLKSDFKFSIYNSFSSLSLFLGIFFILMLL